MKKAWLLILLFVVNNIYCDDIIYIVTQESVLVNDNNSRTQVKEGDILYYHGRADLDTYLSGYNIYVKTVNGNEGYINLDHIMLQTSERLSGNIVEKHWIFSYYLEIIANNNGEALFNNEPFWQNDYETYALRNDGYSSHWSLRFSPTCFFIQDKLTHVYDVPLKDSFLLVHKSQEKTNNTITLQVICTGKSNRNQPEHPFLDFANNNEYLLLFKIDGDYMDVYLNDESNKIFTLIGVDENYIDIIQNITRKNTELYTNSLEITDFSKVFWPRRADGSMDYPPPPVNTSNNQGSLEEIEQVVDSEITLENESPQTTKDSPFPLWLFIGGGLVLLVAVGAGVVVKRKGQVK